MLALRNAFCNDRWAAAWGVIAQGLRSQARVRCQHQRDQRRAIPPRPFRRAVTPATSGPAVVMRGLRMSRKASRLIRGSVRGAFAVNARSPTPPNPETIRHTRGPALA